MMTDLVNEHMSDDGAQAFLVLSPVIENGTAIEEDHIGERARMTHLLAMREAHALEQAEQIEFALGLHVSQHIVFREVRDPYDDIAGKLVKSPGQARISLACERVQFLERWRFEAVQFMQRKPVAWQRSNPSAVIAFTVV
jgi:hypothetical protein